MTRHEKKHHSTDKNNANTNKKNQLPYSMISQHQAMWPTMGKLCKVSNSLTLLFRTKRENITFKTCCHISVWDKVFKNGPSKIF